MTHARGIPSNGTSELLEAWHCRSELHLAVVVASAFVATIALASSDQMRATACVVIFQWVRKADVLRRPPQHDRQGVIERNAVRRIRSEVAS
jgi:hypothetical protein